MTHIKWYYRPCEVPETVYQVLIQDRAAVESAEGKEHVHYCALLVILKLYSEED